MGYDPIVFTDGGEKLRRDTFLPKLSKTFLKNSKISWWSTRTKAGNIFHVELSCRDKSSAIDLSLPGNCLFSIGANHKECLAMTHRYCANNW